MIAYRRSSQRGLHWAVSLLAVLTVILSARPLAAAPGRDAGAFPQTEPGAPVPTRIEGQVKNILGDRWLVDQTWVQCSPDTVLLETRGAAQIGAWVLVVGDQYPDRLAADTIQVLRPAGDPLPLYQFTGILHKMGSPGWLVDDTPIAITSTTEYVGQPAIGGLVRVTARRVANDLQAIEVAEIASSPANVPFAIEGTVEKVSDASWVVDDQQIIVPPDQDLSVDQGDTVEVSAVLDAEGSLVARQARKIDPEREAALAGYVESVDGLGEDNQTWKLIVFSGDQAETHTIKITAETYVDEDRALIEEHVEALVQGEKSGTSSVDAALVQLEQPAPDVATGALAQIGPDGLWRVGSQVVWFASDELMQQAVAAAGAKQSDFGAAGLSAGDASELSIAVEGVRLSNGVLIAKKLLAGHAAELSAAGNATSLTPNGAAAGWNGPNDIVPAVSQASEPTVLFDATGAGHAVFGSGGKVFYAYQPPGGTWDEARKIGTGVTPSALLDSQGHVNVAYASEFLGNWDILHVRLTDKGWSLPTVVAPTSGRSADPVIAADTTGKVYIAWMDRTSGEYAIQLGTFDGNFWTSYPVPDARGQSAALTVLPDGALFLVWQDRIPLDADAWGNYDIFASERKDQNWSMAVNVSDNRQFRPGSDSLGARVVSTSDALAHLAWIDDTTQIRYDFGRGHYWPAPVNVGGQRPNAEGLSLQIAADDLLYVAWNEGPEIRVVASPPRTQYWPAADAVATHNSPANGRVSDVSLTTGRGGVAVTWVQDIGSESMGVYESRHNMAHALLRYFVPMLMQP